MSGQRHVLAVARARGQTWPHKMSDKGNIEAPEADETPDSAAQYIASLADELAKIAKRNGLETLSYLLEMARLEANQEHDEESNDD